jgi:hypothetical protein
MLKVFSTYKFEKIQNTKKSIEHSMDRKIDLARKHYIQKDHKSCSFIFKDVYKLQKRYVNLEKKIQRMNIEENEIEE